MGKVKIKRKSTLIDMTAMSDVTVLLLTFFMLTSTFLQKEPVTVLTPSSVSVEKVPTANLVSILVAPEGQVFLSVAGDADEQMKDEWGTEALRKEWLLNAVSEWNRLHPTREIKLTEQQATAFSKINMFGLRFEELQRFLDLPQAKQDEYLTNLQNGGIPIDDNHDLNSPNQFQIWMSALRKSSNENLATALKTGEGIAVKADKNTEYQTVHNVLDNLQTLKMNRFSIMTALKSSED